jgi:hypothetical protein
MRSRVALGAAAGATRTLSMLRVRKGLACLNGWMSLAVGPVLDRSSYGAYGRLGVPRRLLLLADYDRTAQKKWGLQNAGFHIRRMIPHIDQGIQGVLGYIQRLEPPPSSSRPPEAPASPWAHEQQRDACRIIDNGTEGTGICYQHVPGIWQAQFCLAAPDGNRGKRVSLCSIGSYRVGEVLNRLSGILWTAELTCLSAKG